MSFSSLQHDLIEAIRDAVRINWRFPFRHAAALMGIRLFRVDIPPFGVVTIRTKSTDYAVIRQVFRAREYELADTQQYKTINSYYDEICERGLRPIIIDAGANIGAASIWFAKRFPKATVLAIEPDPENAEICRLNTKNDDSINVIEAAIGSSPGVAVLKNEAMGAWAVQTERSNDSAADRAISIVTIDEMLQRVPGGELFMVKCDIEGFESDLFRNDISWLNEVRILIIEPHDWLFPGKGTSLGFQKAIAERNFEILIRGENLVYVKL